MSVTVRRASPEDVDALVPLFEAYRRFYGQPPDPVGAARFLHERLRKEESVVFLAPGAGSGAAGFVQLYPLFTSVGMRRVWLLNDLFVDPAFRREGVARALMEAARAFAAATGASQLRLATGRENAAARALYASLGYRLDEAFDHYALPLAGGEARGSAPSPESEAG